MGFTVEIPPPVSANNLFFNVPGKGRVKTKLYEDWQRAVTSLVASKVPLADRVAGKAAILVELPKSCRLDIDNAIKPILDALVYSQRIDDDRHVMRLEVWKGCDLEDVRVTVRQHEVTP